VEPVIIRQVAPDEHDAAGKLVVEAYRTLGDAATIRMLGVSADARGRGVGEALVRRCTDEARGRGCKRVRLDTRTSMASAQRLYERLRFRRKPEHDWAPAPGIALVAYVLEC
jgi:ribosomal protein S18 acetylase RimI-like enzyme